MSIHHLLVSASLLLACWLKAPVKISGWLKPGYKYPVIKDKSLKIKLLLVPSL